MSRQELLGCVVMALALLPACDPTCDVTTRATVTDSSDTPIPGATVVEMNSQQCCPSNGCGRTTDAAGVASFEYTVLRGFRECLLAVNKPAYAPGTAAYSFACSPHDPVRNLVSVLLAPE